MTLFIGIQDRIRSLPSFPSWMRWPVIISKAALGIIFIVSGMVKVLDAQSFMATLPLYNIPQWLVPFGALTPPVEVAIGVALVLGIAPRYAALATLGVLAVFSVLLVVGIVGGELDTCGCFGRVLEESPESALVRNSILMLLAGVIWYFHRSSLTTRRSWQGGLIAAILLVLGTVTGYTTHTPKLDPSLARVGGYFPDEGFGRLAPELTGKQLVFVFAVNSHDCWNAAANVKALAADTTYHVFGVTDSDPHEIGWFFNEFDINIKIYSYDPKLFGTTFRTWPALYYLEDGLIIGKAEGQIPSPKTLAEVYMVEWR